jgi:hypothetical protein
MVLISLQRQQGTKQMFDMSRAAMAPIQPVTTKADESHPLFPKYREYVAGMSALGVQAQPFSGYVYCHNRDQISDLFSAMPEYQDFKKWMHTEKPGLTNRRCRPSKDMPHGLSFPENFKVWLTGERW